MTTLELFTRLVRAPTALLNEHGERELSHLAPRLLTIIALCSCFLGFSVGSHHSLQQGIFAGLKMPLVFLLPPLLAVPALAAAGDLLGLPASARRAAAAGLLAMTRIAIFALAFAPVAWLLATVSQSYRVAALATTLHLAVAGLAGLSLLVHTAPGAMRAAWTTRAAMLGVVLALFGTVAAQTGWLLRPFILKPELTPELFQPPESDVFTEVLDRLENPRGSY